MDQDADPSAADAPGRDAPASGAPDPDRKTTDAKAGAGAEADPDAEADTSPQPDGSAPGALGERVEAVARELYDIHPDAFVGARDDAVARARAAGDRDLARDVARLRRPTRAAWLANLLARHRGDQLDGLLALADDLADAQRTLDGAALRALSAQRRRLVAAMAKEGARLAARAGDTATDSVLRDLENILDAALADPGVAQEVRSGRLTRTVSYSGFGVRTGSAGAAADSRAAGRRPAAGGGESGPERGAADGSTDSPRSIGGRAGVDASTHDEQEHAERERTERERAERERAERERAERERRVGEAQDAEAAARDRHLELDAARSDAEATHVDAAARVADLTAELRQARDEERAAAAVAREATTSAKDAARDAAGATARVERARAHLAALD